MHNLNTFIYGMMYTVTTIKDIVSYGGLGQACDSWMNIMAKRSYIKSISTNQQVRHTVFMPPIYGIYGACCNIITIKETTRA